MQLNGNHIKVIAMTEAREKLLYPSKDGFKVLWSLIKEFDKQKAVTPSWVYTDLTFDWHRYHKLVHKQRVALSMKKKCV